MIRLNSAKDRSRYLSAEILDAVVIYVDPQRVTDLIAEELDGIPQESCDLLRQKNLFLSLPMTKEMYNAAARAFHHPYHGTASRLHLEACGLKLLALQVGINSVKLQRGFKQIFGITIGQFLMQQRMTCARELLLNQETGVARAALSVGYSNISYFIRCYKKTFGVTPGSHKQTRDSLCRPV